MQVTTRKNTFKRMLLRRFSMHDHYQKGFSLVELMVVIAILAIIAGISTPMLLSMREKSSVRADARDVYSAFRYAQTEAVKRSASVCILFDKKDGDYKIFLDNGNGVGGVANNAKQDGSEPNLRVDRLRPGSSFDGTIFDVDGKAYLGFNARGLPLAGKLGSVKIHSSALEMELRLSMAGFIKSEVVDS